MWPWTFSSQFPLINVFIAFIISSIGVSCQVYPLPLCYLLANITVSKHTYILSFIFVCWILSSDWTEGLHLLAITAALREVLQITCLYEYTCFFCLDHPGMHDLSIREMKNGWRRVVWCHHNTLLAEAFFHSHVKHEYRSHTKERHYKCLELKRWILWNFANSSGFLKRSFGLHVLI